MRLKPVGVVHSAVKERKGMPPWGVPAQVEILEAYEAALWRIEKHTHLWVVAWLESGPAERGLLQVKPRGLKEGGDEALHGVFAVRSPARPNPLGLTVARVLERDGRVLNFDRLDFIDLTPVVDVKPYFASRDCIFSAHNERVGAPAGAEALREGVLMQAIEFLGTLTPDAALAVRMVEHYRLTRCGGREPERWSVAVPRGRPEMADAVMGMTRVSLGRGTLRIQEADEVEIGGDARYVPRAFEGNALELPAEALFEVHFAV